MEKDSGINPLEVLESLSGATKKVGIARPEDVVSQREEWAKEDMLLPEEKRGPARIKVDMKGGAKVEEFTIRGLTLKEKSVAERMVESVIPPKKTRMEAVPGKPPMEVSDGFDEDAPEYRKQLAEANEKRLLYIVLKGVVGLEKGMPDMDLDAQMERISGMNSRLIEFLASEVWHFSYAGRDYEDFFFKEG